MRKLKIISAVATVCMAASLLPQAAFAANDNDKLTYNRTAPYYDLLDSNRAPTVANTSIQNGSDEEIGKYLTASGNGNGDPSIAYSGTTGDLTDVNYITFAYKYKGDTTAATTTVSDNGGGSTADTQDLVGDGKWHIAVFDVSKTNHTKRGTKYTFEYTDSPKLYNTSFDFAKFYQFQYNPAITEIDKVEAPTIGATSVVPEDTDGDYSIVSAKWLDEDEEEFSGEFEANKTYYFELTLKANENYFFESQDWEFENSNEVDVEYDNYLFENTVTFKIAYDTKGLDIKSSTVEDGATEVEPATEQIVLTFNKALDQSTLNKSNVTITPEIDWSIDVTGASEARIIFDEPLALATSYEIAFSEDIKSSEGLSMLGKTISFTTGDSYPEPTIVSSSIKDGDTGVLLSTSDFEVKFDIAMDTETMTEKNIKIEPAVTYSVISDKNSFKVEYGEKLGSDTTYTISWDGIKSIYGTEPEITSVTFSTVETLKNIIRNGDFEDVDDIHAIDDAQSYTLVKIAEEENGNHYLNWKVGWGQAPILFYYKWQPGHTYYVSARVKSDIATNMYFDFHYVRGTESSYHFQGKKDISPNEWTTISYTFAIPENIDTENRDQSIRIVNNSGTPIVQIDDWEMYDTTLATKGAGNVVAVSPLNGTTEVPIEGSKATIVFDKEINPSTLANITTSPAGAIKSAQISKDLMSCDIEFNTLRVNTKYTVTIPSTVKTMYGESVNPMTFNFTTYTVPAENVKVKSVTPANGEDKVALNDLSMNVKFSTYVNQNTLTAENITCEPDAIKEIIPESDGVQIVFDNDKIQKNSKYTIKLSSAIKSLVNYPLDAFETSFTTKSEQNIVDDFNNVLTKDDAAKFMKENYNDIDGPCDLYDALVASKSQLCDAINEQIASKNASKASDITDAVRQIVLYHVANSGTLDEVAKMFDSDTLGIQKAKIAEVYNKVLDDAGRDTVQKKIKSTSFKASDDIENLCAEQIVLAALSKANGSGTVKKILENSKKYFIGSDDIDDLLTKINKLSNAATVYNQLQELTAGSLSDVKKALSKAYDDAASSGQTGGGGSSSSSGSSSKSSGSVGAAIIASLPASTTAKTEVSYRPFDDIDNISWAKSAIEDFFEKGIVSGKAEKVFAPNDNVTREEFVKMFVLATREFDSTQTADFADIPADHWCAPYIASAVSKGTISGIGSGLFGMGQNITREDIAVILYRYAKDKGINTEDKPEFADLESASGYAKEAITFLSGAGIITGDDGNFRPKSNSTRAEAVVLLSRLISACGA